MQIHNIKILPLYFEDVLKLLKTFEVRKDDRGYSVGDIVNLQEFDGQEYTGRIATVKITYVLKNVPEYGLQDGYCVFSWDSIIGTKHVVCAVD